MRVHSPPTSLPDCAAFQKLCGCAHASFFQSAACMRACVLAGEGRESAYDALRLALRAALFELTGQLLGGSDAHDLTSPDSTEAVQRALQAWQGRERGSHSAHCGHCA
eukprot:584216-Pleurochrysis_carterae.AAC.1